MCSDVGVCKLHRLNGWKRCKRGSRETGRWVLQVAWCRVVELMVAGEERKA